MMSHEIRTPIFGIVGNVCMLMETIIDSDQLALLEHTNESARNLMSVIEDILDFQRVESGKLTIESIPFNIKDVLGQLNKIFMPKALGKSLEFEISPIEKVIPTLGDPNRLSQLLSYLLSNAIKFTFNGSVKLETKFKHLDQENLLFEFTIIDSGIGISSKVLPSIFSPWIQADTSKRRAFGGTGLGLAITKSLVELMKGKISVNSEVNMGTKIVVEIPLMVYKVNSTENRLNFSLSKLIRHQTFRSNMRLCLGTSNQLPYPTNSNTIVKSPSRSKSSRGSKSVRPDLLRRASSNENNTLQKLNINGQPKIFQILIAEDNPVNQAILKRYLQKMGDIEVTMVGDGQAALDAYYAKPKGGFHVILLDQSMPKKDGDEVCREIRKVDSEQIIISVSANVLLADQEHFLSLGMNDHISKPVIYNNFQSVLRKWLHVAQNGKYRDQTSTTSIDEFEAESTDKSSNSNSAPASFKA
ncbi:hypothetical protein K502DRAFT_287274 [Neoconidiobolus thromboides FSU 785]|nr:hypothetical protein K502DRAFT_287274 [Neoconidiobolus thromboides FSU 785]